ncbi:MAG: EamA family transporter RarD [Chloroflexi bacterium]|nr:MAG: EamA family transporter RarD [Chloroflexota bacterium]
MKKGVLFALAGYAIWGFFPLYFKTLQAAPAFQIMAHRVVWSFLLMTAILIFRKELKPMLSAATPRIVFLYAIAGTLLAINWVTYVWGVNAGYVVEASLGYFINPLVSVLLGVIFLRERLRPLQWVPVVLAGVGVTYLTVSMGKLPWIALVLALSFGLYGLMKKITPLGSLQGLTLETAAVFLPTLAYLIIEQVRGVGAFVNAGVNTTLLLAATGVVTAIPLIFFSAGTKLIPLTTVGLLQYITPTTQFLLGVFVFKEGFSSNQVIGFVIIWIALILFTMENLLHYRPVAVETAISSSQAKN